MPDERTRSGTDSATRHELDSVESKYRFLLRLNDQLRRAATAADIPFVAATTLGEALRANRVGYAEGEVARGETTIVRRQYVSDAKPLEGRFRIADYRAGLLERLLSGRTSVQGDVRSDPTLTPAERAANVALGVVAALNVPVVKDGRLVGTLFVHCTRPRAWTADEVALAEAVAERTWDALERARAEERLRVSEARLSIACEAGAIGIFDYDVECDVVHWDARTRALWGVGPDDDVTYAVFLSAIHRDDVVATEDAVRRAMDPHGDGVYSAEFRVLSRSDGHERWIQARGLTTFRGGRPARLVGTVQDVTAMRTTERELRDIDRRKDEFLATLAHELRNPLAPVANGLKVLQRHALPADCVRVVEICARQIRHISRLVDDLLDASRISRGLVALVPERLVLQRCVQSVAEALAERVSTRALHLELDLPERPLRVHADPIRIGQILENLLSNAIRYTDPGGRILVSMRREGASAVIEVHDTGIGILASELPHVFEMFTQVHDERMRSSGGLGIGLALVRKLVEAHGGTVAAHSEGLGEGATFRVALPLASDDDGGDGDGDGDDDPDAGADAARPAP